MAKSYEAGETVSAVARRYALSPQQLFAWRRAARLLLAEVSAPEALFVRRWSQRRCRSRRQGGCRNSGNGKPPDIAPAQLRVIVVRRPKYACRACEDVVVQAPAPARLIEGGLPTEATVARVLVCNHADHLSLYRETQIHSRQGMNLDRSTLADWVGRAAGHLRPVIRKVTIETPLPADAFSLALDEAGYAGTAA